MFMTREPSLKNLGREYAPWSERVNPLRFVRTAWKGIVAGFPELIPPPPQYRIGQLEYAQTTQEFDKLDRRVVLEPPQVEQKEE